MEIIKLTDYENPLFCNAFKAYFKEIEVDVKDFDKLFKEMNHGLDGVKDSTVAMVENNQMIGFLMFRMDEMKHWFLEERIGFIREFWVHPNYRNKGIGSCLLNACEMECKDTNRIMLTPEEDAILFYEKRGYHFEHIQAKNKMDVMVKYVEHPRYNAREMNNIDINNM